MRTVAFILSLSYWLSACGSSLSPSSLSGLRYYLEKGEVGQRELRVEGSEIEDLRMLISGQGIEADIPMGQIVPVNATTKLRCVAGEQCELLVSFYKVDGTLLLRDRLNWIHRSITPEAPIIAFSEEATPDSAVTLLVSESRDRSTQEIWIEGDLADRPEGYWRPIPETSKLPLTLSDEDGWKVLRVKLRNEWYYESEIRELKILKKSQGPKNCRAILLADRSAQNIATLRFEGEDTGPIAYRVIGDVEVETGFQRFEGSTQVSIPLAAGVGLKQLTVQIRDGAENYCLRQDFTVLHDPSYASARVRVLDDRLWTDSEEIDVRLSVDHFPSDKVEVYLYGDLEPTDQSFRWLPLADVMRVRLAPWDGHRWIRAQFRVNGELVDVQYAPIYLRPFVEGRVSSEGSLVLYPSQIVGLKAIRLLGCGTEQGEQAPALSYTCAVPGTEVGVEFVLKDGTRFKLVRLKVPLI